MSAPGQRVPEEEIRRLTASMRTSDIWTLLLMGDLAGGAVAFLVAWYAGWHGLATAVIGVVLLGGLVTLVGWLVAQLREDRVFKKLDLEFEPAAPPPSPPHSARRMPAFVVFVALAIVAAMIFVFFPAAGRWLSLAPALASIVFYAWAAFGGSAPSRSRRHRR